MALAEGSRFFPDLAAAGQARLEALLSPAVPGRLEETGQTLARRPERFPTGTAIRWTWCAAPGASPAAGAILYGDGLPDGHGRRH